MNATITESEGQQRCHWCTSSPELLVYHDTEWGFPVDDNHRLFEKLCLESFQSGLNWKIILAKRENLRAAFLGFDFEQVAFFTEKNILELLGDEGIIRHRGKIEATINNAKRACEITEREGSLAAFIWKFESDSTQKAKPQTVSVSPESVKLSKELKDRGWKFVGPTTVYAFMQAAGLINDHTQHCVIRAAVERARATFSRPCC